MIFISFLGTGNYLTCNYVYNNQHCDGVEYIQTAARTLLAPEAKSFIFVTTAAEEKHLEKLQQEAQKFDLPAMEPITIPTGASEEELWKIFEIISNQIPEGAEIVFDITHSFRSLPLLITILLNYLSVVKHTTIKQCCYGAFETLGIRADVEEMPVSERNAPVFNLTPFFSLNDWARAIYDFTRYGYAAPLQDLISYQLQPILKNPETRDENSKLLQKVSTAIKYFSSFVHTSNCHCLCQMEIKKYISSRLEQLNFDNILPLAPIFKQITQFFAEYEDKSLFNGLRAAKWCAEINLIPQGFTLLQESIVSIELEPHRQRLEEEGLTEAKRQREFISALLGVKDSPDDWKNDLKTFQETAQSIHEEWSKDFLQKYERITSCRNRVNHGGTDPDNKLDSNKITTDLEILTSEILKHYHLRD
ncbi:TIGR02221 family CRISPR-associated protein [Desulforhopalus vacuolatus]|uniref:TIGR02221 family CRISPR-associated protein n=1 Tax=Desulforhopalus vacuolatus TaxID=40414 RepID=UPI00196491F2|nr:TIGR02221 family CRISPR-associated protein [Desulforhopalus vacuolatus]MBM9520560.1 TIGR02221 family CRISPR-associated protein [Desulforhopalus vacuolatus]